MVDDMLCIILDEKFPAVKPRPKDQESGFKLLYRNLQKPEDDKYPCKCKNKDKCRCKKEWGMGDKKYK